MPIHPDAEIEVTAFKAAPAFARGHIKDIRIRWALEEIDLPYRTRLIGGIFGEKPEGYLKDQPFGQVPVLKEGTLTLFESGAILIHLGERDERLLPRNTEGRTRAIAWLIAALNDIESAMQVLLVVGVFGKGQDWREGAREAALPLAQKRLARLSHWLGEREWLEDRFTIGDLVMIDVLRNGDEDLLAAHPNLVAYVERGTARPAFQRAMTAHLEDCVADETITF